MSRNEHPRQTEARRSSQRPARASKELVWGANAPYRPGRSDYGLTALNAESLLSVIRSLKGSAHLQRNHLPSAPPPSLLALHSASALVSVRLVPGSALFRLPFVSFRSSVVQCGRRSLRDCLHAATPSRIAFCSTTPERRAPPPEQAATDPVYTGNEEETRQLHFTHP